MSKKKTSRESFDNFFSEINAVSGQLRYDPITSGYYFDMSEDEKEKAREIVFEKLLGEDERIPLLAYEIWGLSCIEMIKGALLEKQKSLPWRLASLHVVFKATKEFIYVDEILNVFLDEKNSIDIRRLAFSYIDKNTLDAGQIEKLLKTYKKIEDLALRYNVEKCLGLVEFPKEKPHGV